MLIFVENQLVMKRLLFMALAAAVLFAGFPARAIAFPLDYKGLE